MNCESQLCPPSFLQSESPTGALIVNGDDWGRDCETTDRMLECILGNSVSSVSAMVFMEDSERAAAIARERSVDVGLHLNLTTPFSSRYPPAHLVNLHSRVAKHLSHHRLGHILFHPGLSSSFQYVVAAQLEEFSRLYGALPKRIDGHHHAHLCANVLLGRMLPVGAIVRRNFTFVAGEKNLLNRVYRQGVDQILAGRHVLTDFFFSLAPIEPRQRLDRIIHLAKNSVVELETHPVNPEEYRFLMGGEFFRMLGEMKVASGFALRGPEFFGRTWRQSGTN